MNTNEQKNHKTATARLENALEDFSEATDERIATLANGNERPHHSEHRRISRSKLSRSPPLDFQRRLT